MKFTLSLSSYEIDWIEQAKAREDRGLPLDEGTLATLGNILMEKINILKRK
jgi:hypothetical protein